MSRKPSGLIVSSVFFGYSAESISEWCKVPLRTAQRWKRGERFPDVQAAELFRLHRDGRVLSVEHWSDWRTDGDVLIDPEGNKTTQGQLRAYYLVYQLAAELVRDSTERQERFHAIMREVG